MHTTGRPDLCDRQACQATRQPSRVQPRPTLLSTSTPAAWLAEPGSVSTAVHGAGRGVHGGRACTTIAACPRWALIDRHARAPATRIRGTSAQQPGWPQAGGRAHLNLASQSRRLSSSMAPRPCARGRPGAGRAAAALTRRQRAHCANESRSAPKPCRACTGLPIVQCMENCRIDHLVARRTAAQVQQPGRGHVLGSSGLLGSQASFQGEGVTCSGQEVTPSP